MSTRTTTPTRVPDAGTAQLYQMNVAGKLPDAPAFELRLAPYAAYQPFPTEDWTQFKARIDMSLAAATAANDPALPVWDPQKFPGVTVAELSEQASMDSAMSLVFYKAKEYQDVGHDSDLGLEVMLRLAQLAGAANLLPHTVDPNSTVFAWAPVRCVFAAAGPEHHAKICKQFVHESGFPWDADEDPRTWRESVAEAHANCGWPITTAVLRWSSLNNLPEPAEGFLPAWLYWKAWVHVLTHLRWDEVEQQLRVTYGGKCVLIRLDTVTNLLGQQKRILPIVLAALGCVSEVQVRAVMHAMNRLTVMNLLPALGMGELPYTIIAGRWSCLVSDRSVDGWSECGMRVSNAWVAHNQAITRDIDDEEAVLGFAWSTTQQNIDVTRDLQRFETGVPTTFNPLLPGDVLEYMFPNITECGVADPDARKVLVELVLVADILRSQCPCLYGEYPYFAVLPDAPTLESSVNQGKTTLCMHYAKASVPGISGAMRFRDTNSAPDQRAIADEIRKFGTVCLDEFAIPKMDTALLSRSNLASLTVGMPVAVGKVMSNENEPVRLRHPICLSAKALELSEDLLTRGIYVFLRQFTPAERNRPGVWESLKSAQLGIMLRLGTVAMIEREGFAATLNAMQHSTQGFRYGAHRSLGILLYQHRTKCSWAQAEGAFLAAIATNRAYMSTHIRSADDQGVIMSMRDNRDVRITLEQLFADVTASDAALMKTYIDTKGQGMLTFRRATMAQLMRARMAIDGRQDQPLGNGFNQVTNFGGVVGDRLVSTALATEVKRRIPEGAAWRLPGIAGTLGWFLYRYRTRKDNTMLVTIEQHLQYAMHETLGL